MFNNGVRHMNSMPHQIAARRDTRAWVVQVWVSFGLAAFLSATGLYWLPGSLIERAFMVMAYVFSLSSVFVLSRHVRDQADGLSQTPMWGLVVWTGFGAALTLTGWGLWQMPISPDYKAYLMVCWLFMVAQAFTLAKTLRDAHEAQGRHPASRVNPTQPRDTDIA